MSTQKYIDGERGWIDALLNETTCQWEVPVAYPDDGKFYEWDESAYQADNSTGWALIT